MKRRYSVVLVCVVAGILLYGCGDVVSSSIKETADQIINESTEAMLNTKTEKKTL